MNCTSQRCHLNQKSMRSSTMNAVLMDCFVGDLWPPTVQHPQKIVL
uniref:Uncharacterized protein n=1 Tax=Arundo donax TaxID=35708 RepID=A0A0A9EQU1_ARUDO